MKLIYAVLLCCLFSSSLLFAQTPGKITLSVRNAKLISVLNLLKKQAGYTFFYNEDILDKAERVTLDVKDMDIQTVLALCFRSQRHLTYSVENQAVVIMEKRKATITIATPGEIALLPFKVHGVVLNKDGERISNATILINRTKKGTITGPDGSFELENIKQEDTLTISYIGYKLQQQPVAGQPQLIIMLTEAVDQLDEVVKQAYSNTSQRFSTGNITTIKAAEIEKQPVMNPLLTLQGRVPGLLVTQNNGFASAPVKVDIRGIGNLAQATEPLYIVDGVPLSVLMDSRYGYGLSQTAYGASRSVAGGESPLFNMNPNDIESISVLTGADATAIYGSRGANGVILITTKKGKVGPTRFDINFTQGISSITRYWDMLNTPQYLQMRREALKNDGLSPTPFNAPDLTVWDTSRYTNWQKEVFGHLGKNTKVSAGISGGDQQTLFRINADYNKVTDISTLSGSTQRATVGFNLDHNTYNRRFSVSISAFYTYSDINLTPLAYNVNAAPDAPSILDNRGNPNWAAWNQNGLLDIYPFGPSLTSNPEKTNFLTSNIQFNYRPVTGLVFSVNMGYNYANNTTNNFQPISSQNPYKTNTGTASFNTTINRGWIVEPQLSYHTLLWKGNMDVIVGGTFNNVKTSASTLNGTGYTDDNLLYSINNAPAVTAQDESALYKYGGLLAIVKYNLENKYILNLNGRRDGSSRFGPGKQFGNFGSVGAAWIASEEKWLKQSLPSFINFVKFKSSIGVLGSDGGVGDYQYLSLWSASFNQSALPPYGGIQPYQPYNPPNQEFHWASTRNIDAGIELGFLKGNRIYTQIRYYMNRTTDQLAVNPLPSFTGFTNLYQNLPATIQNTGWEAILNADIIKSNNFNWSFHFNISANKNKLVSFPGLENSGFANQYAVGMPLNTRYVLHYIGVDPLTGQYAFEDHDKSGTITSSGIPPTQKNPNDDYVVLKLDPKFFGGFGTMFSYKSLAVSIDFYYKKQIGRNALAGNYGVLNSNAPAEVFANRWQKPGDIAKFPAFTTLFNINQGYFAQSDGAYSDASYIRLNNLSFYYSLPDTWLKRTGIKSCRLYMNAQNVFVITGYKGIDPETQNFGGMPPARVFTGGVTFNF